MTGPTLLYILIALAAVWIIASRKRQRHRYPPGPKGLPIIGNVFDVPMENGWVVYRDWARQYDSDIIHLQALGKHIIVINGAAASKELLDKRTHTYSHKEHSVMLTELTGWHRNWGTLPYGDYWRTHRRLFHQYFRPLAVPQYHSKQSKAVHKLLQLLLNSGDDFVPHVRYMAGSMILDIVYAADAQPGDHRIELVEKAEYTLNHIVDAGIFLVDVFPILKHVPAWFPGARFKRQAAEWKMLVDAMYEEPYNQFKTAMKDGSAQPCLAASLLSDTNETDPSTFDEVFINITGTTYAAGGDTTVIALTTFVLAMVLYPEAQALVQEEIDRVVGRDRLPEVDDQKFLPCVTAVMYEVLRWHSPIPLVLHSAMTDDEYNGYHIPAGSVVMGNSWAILHDEETYPDPYTFNPKRFLSADGKLRDDIPLPMETFGYGRRISAFNIEKALDENGKVIEVKEEFAPHLFSPPKPFEARFMPRYSGVESLIRSAVLADA